MATAGRGEEAEGEGEEGEEEEAAVFDASPLTDFLERSKTIASSASSANDLLAGEEEDEDEEETRSSVDDGKGAGEVGEWDRG